jgi:hypothetical protein
MSSPHILSVLVLASLSSAALAGTAAVSTGAHSGGGGSHAAPPAPAHAAANVSVTAGAHIAGLSALSSGALKGATLTHTMVGGQHANVVEMPLKCPLKEHEIRKLRQSGFHSIAQNGDVYYCRHEHWTQDGWIKDCFRPAVR